MSEHDQVDPRAAAIADSTAPSESPSKIDRSDETPMIEADRLSKFYGIFAATREVSFKVYSGEVVAFLGPNGAKTVHAR